MTEYLIGLMGCWLFCDGIISIMLYLKTVDHDGKRLQSWEFDHSIRIIRIIIGIVLMILASPI